MAARLPVALTNSHTASTLGPMDPAGKVIDYILVKAGNPTDGESQSEA